MQSRPPRRSLLRSGLAGIVLLLPGELVAGSPHIAPFGVVEATYSDVDGDLDPFPDPGETGRLVVTIRNGAAPFTGAALVLMSADPEVECVPDWKIPIGSLAAGQVVATGDFTLKVSPALASTSGADPARIDLCVRLKADQIQHVSAPVCFFLPADLDLPGGATQTFIDGPDGLPGTADDGTLLEDFDMDRDGDGNFTVHDTFRGTDAGTGQIVHGGYLRAVGQPGAGLLAGESCGGFQTPLSYPPCTLDPDYPMDWHLHCPPGATTCPNVESGACVDGIPGAACTYATPSDGQKGLSLPNSLHMGLHFAGRDSFWDTTHLRSLQAFVSAPVNLAVVPRPGDLKLSMFHIAALMDTNHVVPGDAGECLDCADVQAQIDRDPDPAADDWGYWDKLAPFQNVYDHTPSAWSVYTSNYCEFTPTDTGTAPPAPRGVHETMCFRQGAWSSCGSVRGTATGSVADCAGPGIPDPSGSGVWVETRFDLSSHLGQRIRVRWIGSSWAFDEPTPHYASLDSTWNTIPADDGWWLDDITFTGILTTQTTPVPDARPAVAGACPDVCTDIDDDGHGSPGSGLCPGGSQNDCDDLRSDIHPGAPEGCNRTDNDCDGQLSIEERDADSDGYAICEGDCDDTHYRTHPNAREENDGVDNNCPPDAGYGLVDEIDNNIVFVSPSQLAGISQVLATEKQVVRSTRVDFSGDCATFTITGSSLPQPETPPDGTVWFYLARATSPHVGSWGADSAGVELIVPCVP